MSTYGVAPTAASLGRLTAQYVGASGQPNANGVIQSLQNKLLHGLICQCIAKVTMEATGSNPTLTTAQANELIYWARLMDPSC